VGGSLHRVGRPVRLILMHQEPERPLSDRERAILDFERDWWTDATCSKEKAIRDRLGLSSARYYGILGDLLDVPAAMDYDPLVIRRRRRGRDERRRARFEGRSAGPSAR
jgi:hypothetical protein